MPNLKTDVTNCRIEFYSRLDSLFKEHGGGPTDIFVTRPDISIVAREYGCDEDALISYIEKNTNLRII